MSQPGPDVLRYVPTESCRRCGADVDQERHAFVLAESTRDDGEVESGTLCADCFDELLNEVT